MDDPEQWLDHEDRVEREVRLRRLRWLADQRQKVDRMLYGTGPITKYLFDEARYWFAYGQYLASLVLGLAFIELSLGAHFTEQEALASGWLSQSDYEAID